MDVRRQHPLLIISQNLDDYEVVQDVGSGQFGVVQKVRLRSGPDTFFVWKKINYQRQTEKEKELLTSEVQLLRTLHHPNVVRYLGRINDKENACLHLLMEYCDGGDLATYLEHTVRKGHLLTEELILSWCRQLVNALHYCHTREQGKVLHRDLKPQNILLCGETRSRIKLADFGLAKMLSPGQLMTQTHVGTPYYMSPEVLARQEYNEKSDVWSLGCLIHEMMTGQSPFAQAKSLNELCSMVKTFRSKTIVSEHYTPELNALTIRMLSLDVRQRPSTEELKKSLVYRYATLCAATNPELIKATDQLRIEVKSLRQQLATETKRSTAAEAKVSELTVKGEKTKEEHVKVLTTCKAALERARSELGFLEVGYHIWGI